MPTSGPIEPPESLWDLSGPVPSFSELAGVGADLEPGTILQAYRNGLFPMPLDDDAIGWWSPRQRGVIELDQLHVSRSLRRSMRRFEFRINTAFEEVVDGCADPDRSGAWINDDIKAAYIELRRLGWAHSIETWRDERLVGGLYGLNLGGLFAAESKFHRETDASKAAVVALADVLRDGYPRLIDVQWQTPHLARLGASTLSRRRYAERLPNLLDQPHPEALTRNL